MYKKLLPVFTILLFWSCLPDRIFNTTPSILFSGILTEVRLLGGSDEEVAREMIELREGGFAMVGSTNSIDGDFIDRSSNDWDLFLIKMDQQGEVTWKKTYGGSADDFGLSLIHI